MKKIRNKIALSLVIPVFNEEETAPILIKKLNEAKKLFPLKTEVIFVNDGSKDKTLEILQKSKLNYPKKIISFSRNFGHQSALLAGLEESKGEYTVTLDGDLQHPLALIPKMLKQHGLGYDIVLTHRIDGTVTNIFKKITAWIFYYLLRILSQTPIEPNSSDFRSLNKKALKSLLSLPEKRKFLRGMVHWIGYKSVIIPFKVGKRVKGESKYTLLKMVNLGLYGLTSFSTLPLYVSGFFSILLFVLAGLYALYVLYARFYGSGVVNGWASVLFMVLLIGGLLSLFLGVLGAYVAAIFDEVKQRPSFIVKKKEIYAKK